MEVCTAAGVSKGILDADRVGATGAVTATAQTRPWCGSRGGRHLFGRHDDDLLLGTTAASDTQIADMMKVVDFGSEGHDDRRDQARRAAKSSIDLQKTFTSSLMDSHDRGVGQLVDADMNKESTRLQASVAASSLASRPLSIANGSSQSILSLFRG
ncbi:flagellin [Mesorhizobium atlanticum]